MAGLVKAVKKAPVPLDVVADEPGIRLGCLELYVQLGGPDTKDGGEDNRGRFSVEEDQRQRVLVHWRNPPSDKSATENGSATTASPDQTWRVSCAFSRKNSEAALYDTLGMEAVDWLWDGLSSLVLALGPSGFASEISEPLFGQGCDAEFNSARAAYSKSTTGANPHGLLGFCFEELCKRVEAEPDPQRYCLGLSAWELHGGESKDLLITDGEDAAAELRFETVQFRTLKEAIRLLQSVGVNVGSSAPSLPSCGFGVDRHLFVRAVIFDAHRESMAALHFAQVACGSETVGGSSGSSSSPVLSDRKALWDLLDAASTGDVPAAKATCRLTEVLSPLVSGNCKAFFLCSVPEKPIDAAAAREAQDLLDLSERASLITAQCSRVQGVRRDDFQLAELEETVKQMEGRSQTARQSESRVATSDEAEQQPHQRSQTHSDTAGISAATDVPEGASDRVLSHTAQPSSPSSSKQASSSNNGMVPQPADTAASASAQGYSSSRLQWAPGSPVRPTFPDDELVVYNDTEVSSQPQFHAATSSTSRPASTSNVPAAHSSPHQQSSSLGSLGARIAHAACLDECRELSAACARLRVENKAKAAQRKKELADIHAENAALQEAIASFENKCEAPELLEGFKNEVKALKSEAKRLREENATLAGAKGPEACQNAKRSTLSALKAEVTKLRQSTADVEQGEKRANLVNHCLHEVRSRLDLAKRKLSDADREVAALQPAYNELGRQIEHSERRRRWAQEELDRLRRASGGLRAEVAQLREVRDCVDSLPAHASKATASPRKAGNAAESAALERFAVLQRRLAAAAPQLMPLCTRARAEMEELVRCCRHLEERQRRLQQVAPLAEDIEAGAGRFSCNTSVGSAMSGSTGAAAWRARSSDAGSRAGSRSGRPAQQPLNLRPMTPDRVHDPLPTFGLADPAEAAAPIGIAIDNMPAHGRSDSAGPASRASTPRRSAPHGTSTPRRTASQGRAAAADTKPSPRGRTSTPRGNVSPRRAASGGSYAHALKSWVLDRDTSPHGTRARSQDRSPAGRLSRPQSQERPEVALEGAAAALRDLGVHVPMGSPSRVHGMQLMPGPPVRLKASSAHPAERVEYSRQAALSFRPGSRNQR